MLNKKRQAGTKAQQRKNAEVTTSSHTIGKPNVICSQSGLYSFKIENEFLILKSKGMDLKNWLNLSMVLFQTVDNFYKWFDEKYKSKEFSIVAKVGTGFYVDISQMRELYSLMSSKPKLVNPPS